MMGIHDQRQKMEKSKLRQLTISRASAKIEAKFDPEYDQWRIILDGLDLADDIARMIISHPDAIYSRGDDRALENVMVHINVTII